MRKYAYAVKNVKLFPLGRTEILKTLEKFAQLYRQIPVEDLRKVSLRIKKACEHYNIEVPQIIKNYTAKTKNPLFGIHLNKRASAIQGLAKEKEGIFWLNSINKKLSVAKKPSDLLKIAHELIYFDEIYGLTSMYKFGLADPWQTVFFNIPEKKDELTEKLTKLAQDEEKMAKIAEIFPSSFYKKFKQNPIKTYKMSSRTYKEILNKIMAGEI